MNNIVSIITHPAAWSGLVRIITLISRRSRALFEIRLGLSSSLVQSTKTKGIKDTTGGIFRQLATPGLLMTFSIVMALFIFKFDWALGVVVEAYSELMITPLSPTAL